MIHKRKNLQRQQRSSMLGLYTAFLTVLSASIVLMPIGIKMADKTMAISYTSGAMFWIGLIGTIAMAIFITYSKCRSSEFKKNYPHLKQLGIIHFFQNTPALICDVLMFLSIVGFVIVRIWFWETIYPFLVLFILIFSFGMHCMLNGSNYIYTNFK